MNTITVISARQVQDAAEVLGEYLVDDVVGIGGLSGASAEDLVLLVAAVRYAEEVGASDESDLAECIETVRTLGAERVAVLLAGGTLEDLAL